MEPIPFQSEDQDVGQSHDSSNIEIYEQELQHFQNVVNAFQSYKIHSTEMISKKTEYIASLPDYQQSLLKSHTAHLHKMYTCIGHNYEVIKLILENVSNIFQNDSPKEVKTCSTPASASEIKKVYSVLMQIYREWSADAEEERNASFKLILNEIEERFPNKEKHKEIKVLVPGAGLGRLPYEIAKLGFISEGNELSLFMLFASNFILNKCEGVNIHSIYPWVHQCYNFIKSDDQFQLVSFPDKNPADLPSEKNFSMAAGSFKDIYIHPENWDCIATCFFLDTAGNVINYIETILKILKPGGLWINLGPLLYHFADDPDQDSIEPTYQVIKTIIQDMGFLFCKEVFDVPTSYCHNKKSLMNCTYKSVFFVCMKPEKEIETDQNG